MVPDRTVLVAHGVAPGKRSEEVVAAVADLRRQGYDFEVAIAGKARYWTDELTRAEEAGWLHFLGPLPNGALRSLMARCLIHVNVCTEEGMPRSSLEAIDAGTLTVLPPGVPEFERSCPDWIGTAGDPQALAQDILTVCTRGQRTPYPLERHTPERVAEAYTDLISTDTFPRSPS
jgi:glycosyltransferase involved in cell wall biosynthesis